MRRYVFFALLALLLAPSVSACVEADLGEAPVFCNLYEPRCPKGYQCVKRGADEICVREGAVLDQSDGGPAAQPD